jgi:thiamine-monophosphate kinase
MKLSALGEDAVVAGLPFPQQGNDVIVGPGDDCAVIGKRRDRWWRLLKTDVVVEGIHFLSDAEPERIGKKAINRAISDFAAMGGLPEHALITVALSPSTRMEWLTALYKGMGAAAARFGVSIVGGETSRSPGPAFINVALSGRVERKCCVLRSGGKPGDVLYVTGRLGGSRAGKHLDFTPRIDEARFLATRHRPHAMMDISDGLAADLPRLARASGCGFELRENEVPRTPGCSIKKALTDGEDFELLFAVPKTRAQQLERGWNRQFAMLPLTCIGNLTPLGSSPSTRAQRHGHDHFA